MTELYPRPNEQKGGKGAVPVTNIDFSSRRPDQCLGLIYIFFFCLFSFITLKLNVNLKVGK